MTPPRPVSVALSVAALPAVLSVAAPASAALLPDERPTFTGDAYTSYVGQNLVDTTGSDRVFLAGAYSTFSSEAPGLDGFGAAFDGSSQLAGRSTGRLEPDGTRPGAFIMDVRRQERIITFDNNTASDPSDDRTFVYIDFFGNSVQDDLTAGFTVEAIDSDAGEGPYSAVGFSFFIGRQNLLARPGEQGLPQDDLLIYDDGRIPVLGDAFLIAEDLELFLGQVQRDPDRGAGAYVEQQLQAGAVRVDPLTGGISAEATFDLTDLDYDRLSIAFEVVDVLPAVPEPTSLALLGVAGLGLTRRR